MKKTRSELHGILHEIIDRFSKEEIIDKDYSLGYIDGGIDPLWPRFNRAAGNQIEEGIATVSRYAIWANTVRDNIIYGLELVKSGKINEAEYYFIRAANSLTAFSELQSYMDPFDD